ncbi:hypothetical protein G7059_09825 [Erysipelothrix sp. HDW6A]|uniref:hypothetical protein n=1 Tax=Erysipelothrix sp. HDW6A TaxID=2714928 RepID=UPI00140956EB|nr:hypothetical protein [Erysipelothrix sp. HDW6A]QIK58120.1 hypothetical protein G7059_09825 [Erysipelothrix sp. HDW6A]
MNYQKTILDSIRNISITGGKIKTIHVRFVEEDDISIRVEGDLSEYKEEINFQHLDIYTINEEHKNVNINDLPRIERMEIDLPLHYSGGMDVDAVGTIVSIMSKEIRTLSSLSFDGVDLDINVQNIHSSIEIDGVNTKLNANGVSGSIDSDGVKNLVYVRNVQNSLNIEMDGVSSKIYLVNPKDAVNYKVSLDGLKSKIYYNGKVNKGFGSMHFTSPSYNPQSPTITIDADGLSSTVHIDEE